MGDDTLAGEAFSISELRAYEYISSVKGGTQSYSSKVSFISDFSFQLKRALLCSEENIQG